MFGPWLGGVLVASGLSTLGFGVFAIAGLLGAAMVALVRRPAPVSAGRLGSPETAQVNLP
ncbi:hypothetical protein [Amycolatopsis sp. NPDC003731]